MVQVVSARVLFTFCVLLTWTYRVIGGGLEGTLCSRNPAGSKVILQCEVDCQHNHASVGGSCGNPNYDDFNCYCGQPSNQVYNRSLQCIRPDDGYRNFCTMDCICNHAALGGRCDWSLKACMCQGVGENKMNKHCPFTKSQEFSLYSRDMFQSVGINSFEGFNDQGDGYGPSGVIEVPY